MLGASFFKIRELKVYVDVCQSKKILKDHAWIPWFFLELGDGHSVLGAPFKNVMRGTWSLSNDVNLSRWKSSRYGDQAYNLLFKDFWELNKAFPLAFLTNFLQDHALVFIKKIQMETIVSENIYHFIHSLS